MRRRSAFAFAVSFCGLQSRQPLRRHCGAPHCVAYLLDSLRDLDRSLRERGARLVVRHGDPVEDALRVATGCGAEAIHLSDDYSAYARRRGAAGGGVRAGTAGAPRPPGVTVAAPGELLPTGGDHGPRRRLDYPTPSPTTRGRQRSTFPRSRLGVESRPWHQAHCS